MKVGFCIPSLEFAIWRTDHNGDMYVGRAPLEANLHEHFKLGPGDDVIQDGAVAVVVVDQMPHYHHRSAQPKLPGTTRPKIMQVLESADRESLVLRNHLESPPQSFDPDNIIYGPHNMRYINGQAFHANPEHPAPFQALQHARLQKAKGEPYFESHVHDGLLMQAMRPTVAHPITNTLRMLRKLNAHPSPMMTPELSPSTDEDTHILRDNYREITRGVPDEAKI